MDDIRRDVIEAFDKNQAQLGDLRGVRERMLRGAYAGRSIRSDNGLHLIAGIAAILIAALVIGTFVYVRAVSQPSPAGNLNVPDTTPVILYHDPAKVEQIDGITWDGRASGRVGDGGINGETSNSAGTRYATAMDIRDRTGRVSGPLAFAWANGFHARWADDELSYCQVVPEFLSGLGAGPGMLQLVVPGVSETNVGEIGTFGPLAENGPIPTVAACSVQNDRAVVFEAAVSPGLSVQDWVIQLSTGRVLWTHTIKTSPTTFAVGIKATHDGQFVAESTVLPSSGEATIFGPDGSAITHYAAIVEDFSWDGSLAVISPSSGSPVQLIRWRVGAVAWTGPAGLFYRDSRAEPTGTRMAIGLVDNYSANVTDVRKVNLYVVSADGLLVWSKNNIYLA